MKEIRVSTGPDASASLGIVTAANFYPIVGGVAADTLRNFTYQAEVEALQRQALELGAEAVTGISFIANNLPGGLYVVATGTATKG